MARLLEQNADPARLINWFDDFDGPNKYGFLSNFFKGDPIDMNDGFGPVWLTGEHAFAAYKASNLKDFRKISKAPGPGAAKALGRRIKLRDDWELVKYDVMRAVLAAKFNHDRPEGQMLLDTGDAFLMEGTDWNDRVWGVNNSNGKGRNWLGELLMARRAHLRSGVEPLLINKSLLKFSMPTLEA